VRGALLWRISPLPPFRLGFSKREREMGNKLLNFPFYPTAERFSSSLCSLLSFPPPTFSVSRRRGYRFNFREHGVPPITDFFFLFSTPPLFLLPPLVVGERSFFSPLYKDTQRKGRGRRKNPHSSPSYLRREEIFSASFPNGRREKRDPLPPSDPPFPHQREGK